MADDRTLPHIVIVGGGFGGLAATRALAGAAVRVTLIDRQNHHCFQPLLYQVATAALEPGDIAFPIRSIFARQKNVTVLLDEAGPVDLPSRTLALADLGSISFDSLILACGSRTTYYGNDGWRDHAPGLKDVRDALEIRRRVLLAFEAAERCGDAAAQSAWMTFVIIGGGPTGVEMAGAIAEMARYTLGRDFRRIDPVASRIVLVQAEDQLLAGYEPPLSQAAERQLRELGVEVRCGERVSDIDDEGATIGSFRIPARNVIWAAGVSPAAIAQKLGLPHDRRGQVPVDDRLCLPGNPRVFVIGDLAGAVSDGKAVPGVANAAVQGGRHAAQCIRDDLRGRPRSPFRYRDRGSLATVGRNRAVAQLPWLSLSGMPAWLIWGLVHIALLIGFRSRIVVMITWIWTWATHRRGARVVIGRTHRRTVHDGESRAQVPILDGGTTELQRRNPCDTTESTNPTRA